jgi:hypothetical protein
MNILSRTELGALFGKNVPPCVSVYMPTHKTGQQTRQNPIRLKNLLGKAEDLLTGNGMRRPEAKQLLEPAERLVGDASFWARQGDGLALFRSQDQFRYYRMGASFEELVVVAENFHIKPLIPIFASDGPFYVLAISQEQIRLLNCTRRSVREVELKDAPKSFAEWMKYTDMEKSSQLHGGNTGHRGKQGAVFHGHGSSATDEALKKKYVSDYLNHVDKGVRKTLGAERAPLVLAGVDFLCALYRENSQYPTLMEEGISGNPDLKSSDDLHKLAWDIVQSHFQKDQDIALAKYRQLVGTNRVSLETREIIPAAAAGRIESLFVATGNHQWGRYDTASAQVTLHEKEEPGDEDLLDTAAIHTLVNSGIVHAMEMSRMPYACAMAAVYRY